MNIVYDQPIQVTKAQYYELMKECDGVVAGRIDENGNHFIKVWLMSHKQMVMDIIKKTK